MASEGRERARLRRERQQRRRRKARVDDASAAEGLAPSAIGDSPAEEEAIDEMDSKPAGSWLSRNWTWAVPIVGIGIILFAVVIVGSLSLLMRSSWAYGNGVALAQSNADVRRQLGEPVETGWMPSGSIKTTGPSGRAELVIPLEGSRKDGTLYVVAVMRLGKWQLEQAEVDVGGFAHRINLLAVDEGTKGP